MNAVSCDQSGIEAFNVEYFINLAPTRLVLRRKEEESDGAGGRRMTEETGLPSQQVRVIGMRRPTSRVTADGREVIVNKAVLGMSDLDVKIGDTFDWTDGFEYEVVTVQRDPTYRVLAEVMNRG